MCFPRIYFFLCVTFLRACYVLSHAFAALVSRAEKTKWEMKWRRNTRPACAHGMQPRIYGLCNIVGFLKLYHRYLSRQKIKYKYLFLCLNCLISEGKLNLFNHVRVSGHLLTDSVSSIRHPDIRVKHGSL